MTKQEAVKYAVEALRASSNEQANEAADVLDAQRDPRLAVLLEQNRAQVVMDLAEQLRDCLIDTADELLDTMDDDELWENVKWAHAEDTRDDRWEEMPWSEAKDELPTKGIQE